MFDWISRLRQRAIQASISALHAEQELQTEILATARARKATERRLRAMSGLPTAPALPDEPDKVRARQCAIEYAQQHARYDEAEASAEIYAKTEGLPPDRRLRIRDTALALLLFLGMERARAGTLPSVFPYFPSTSVHSEDEYEDEAMRYFQTQRYFDRTDASSQLSRKLQHSAIEEWLAEGFSFEECRFILERAHRIQHGPHVSRRGVIDIPAIMANVQETVKDVEAKYGVSTSTPPRSLPRGTRRW